jgi:hypothetical protein
VAAQQAELDLWFTGEDNSHRQDASESFFSNESGIGSIEFVAANLNHDVQALRRRDQKTAEGIRRRVRRMADAPKGIH